MPDGPGEPRGGAGLRGAGGGRRPGFEFPDLDENAGGGDVLHERHHGAAQGVLYSHRSIVLHTLGAALPDSMGIHEADSVMPVVPMFHAMAWGIPYVATMLGARQVLPGPDLSPQALAQPDRAEGVTWSAGVPTIWNGFLELDPRPTSPACGSSRRGLSRAGAPDPRLPGALRSAAGAGWGMTETSPLAAVCRLPAGAGSRGRGLRAASHQGRVRRWSSSDRRGIGRRAAGPWAVDRARLLPGPERRREVHRRRLAADRRRRRARRRRVHQARRPHQGPGEVGRRVDLLGRARERDHGSPRRGRGRRDRGPDDAGASARAPAWSAGRAPSSTPRACERTSAGGRQVVGPGALRVHRRGAKDLGRQVRQEGAAARFAAGEAGSPPSRADSQHGRHPPSGSSSPQPARVPAPSAGQVVVDPVNPALSHRDHLPEVEIHRNAFPCRGRGSGRGQDLPARALHELPGRHLPLLPGSEEEVPEVDDLEAPVRVCGASGAAPSTKFQVISSCMNSGGALPLPAVQGLLGLAQRFDIGGHPHLQRQPA